MTSREGRGRGTAGARRCSGTERPRSPSVHRFRTCFELFELVAIGIFLALFARMPFPLFETLPTVRYVSVSRVSARASFPEADHHRELDDLAQSLPTTARAEAAQEHFLYGWRRSARSRPRRSRPRDAPVTPWRQRRAASPRSRAEAPPRDGRNRPFIARYATRLRAAQPPHALPQGEARLPPALDLRARISRRAFRARAAEPPRRARGGTPRGASTFELGLYRSDSNGTSTVPKTPPSD